MKKVGMYSSEEQNGLLALPVELTKEEWKIMHDFVHLMDRKIDDGESWEYRITYKL